MRKFTLDRWNWSDRAQKWVYVTKDKRDKRSYIYKIEPPASFIALTMEIKRINDILIKTEDPEESNRLFEQLIEISKKMQNMRKEDYEPI